MRGKFIAFEGLDGTGKSTVLAAVAGRLRAAGTSLVTTREPGGTEAGAAIRALILDGAPTLTARTELLLMCADRAQHVETVILPSLDRGETVLSDRFEASTRAYQGHGLGVPASDITMVLEIATGGLRPDLYVLFDLDPERATARRHADSDTVNALDDRALSFKQAVRDAYLRMAATEPGWAVVDAGQELTDVVDSVTRLVSRTLTASTGVR